MKLEVGKKYQLRNGEVITIAARETGVIGYDFVDTDGYYYTTTGAWLTCDIASPHDVVAEAAPEVSSATKHDASKVRLELLPFESIEEIGKVLTFGAKKYDAYNWTKGMSWSRLLGAALRHLFAWGRGEDNDPESGISHLAHAACCIVFLLYYTKHKASFDDRFKGAGSEYSEPLHGDPTSAANGGLGGT